MDLNQLSSPRLAILAGLVIVAFVVLSVAHVDTSQLVTLVGVLIGGGGVVAHQSVRLDRQDKALDKITNQTNGVLDSRIEAGARKAIRHELRQMGYPIQPAPELDE